MAEAVPGRDAASRNADGLRARFAQLVLAHGPESVLDVGCGRGVLLDACRAAGVARCMGIEVDPDAVASCRARGHDVLAVPGEGTIGEVLASFESGSFDVVAMRHVLHHLPDPGVAVTAMVRVARNRLVLAEPWFDRAVASQRVAEDFDLWLKREHRRRGRVHGPNLTIERILELLPQDATATWEYRLDLRPRPLEDLTDESAGYLVELPRGSSETREHDALVSRARSDGVSCNGSLMVTVRIA